MTTVKVQRIGTRSDGNNWAQLAKLEDTPFGEIKKTCFIEPTNQLEVEQEFEINKDLDDQLRWEA